MPDPAVALAGGLLQTCSVRDGDAASALLDQPSGLKGAGDHAHAGALHAQHLAQELVREGQGVLIRPVMHGQDPAAAARLDGMNSVAGDRLKRLSQEGLAVVQDQLPQRGTGLLNLTQASMCRLSSAG